MNNGRFATALHIMTLLSTEDGQLLSSEYIAGSINLNPAIVRKAIGNLRNSGLVDSKEGKGGGSTLGKAAGDIRLSDIYQSVRESPLLGRKNDPNPACPIGRQINQHIDALYQKAEEAMVQTLEKTTLADFMHQFS